MIPVLVGLLCVLDRGERVALSQATPGTTRSWPLFGGTLSRNMVNAVDKDMPTDWSIVEGKRKNIKWMAQLGNKAYGGPVIAGGKVFVGTNNASPRDPGVKGHKAVVMCFAEADGKFLWQALHDIPPDDIFKDAVPQGLCSTPAVDGNRLYYVTPGCELICAKTENGAGIWRLDMMKDLKVVPYHLGNCSPLVAGDLVYVVTSNGVDESGKIASPKAPSFIAVNKETGKVAWQSDLPGENIIEGQWSNPAYGIVNGKRQVIFPGGDGWIYAFEPQKGELIWKFNGNAGLGTVKDGKTLNYIVATPVIVDNKVYVGMGLYPEHPKATKFSHLLCIDMTKSGDVSPASLDAKAGGNGKSALVWAYGGMANPAPAKGRSVIFGRTMSTAAVHDGLVYIAEETGYLHCLDAKTGQKYWEHDFLSAVWGSPYWVDGKVYIGTEDGDIVIFAHGKEKKISRQVSMEETVHSTPVAVNGVLYVATR
jgi:outer membrane protein assembly factor BamB